MSYHFTMRLLRIAALAAVAIVGSSLVGSHRAQAQDYCGPYSRPDLFYNYYVPPVSCCDRGAEGAELYVSPRPTPPLVGHTYITYLCITITAAITVTTVPTPVSRALMCGGGNLELPFDAF